MDYPRTYKSIADLPSVTAAVRDVLTRLIERDDPILAGLRVQLSRMTVASVEMTGTGFHAELLVAADVPVVQPPPLVGGAAEIELSCAKQGAGYLLFVEDGRLASLEGYIYGDEEWRPDSVVLSVGHVSALEPSNKALKATDGRGPPPRVNATSFHGLELLTRVVVVGCDASADHLRILSLGDIRLQSDPATRAPARLACALSEANGLGAQKR